MFPGLKLVLLQCCKFGMLRRALLTNFKTPLGDIMISVRDPEHQPWWMLHVNFITNEETRCTRPQSNSLIMLNISDPDSSLGNWVSNLAARTTNMCDNSVQNSPAAKSWHLRPRMGHLTTSFWHRLVHLGHASTNGKSTPPPTPYKSATQLRGTSA